MLISSDVRDLSRQFSTWHSAIEATAPRLLVDGNLVKLDALLKTEQDILTVICNIDNQIILRNIQIDNIQDCTDVLNGIYEKLPLIFDSRQVGWLLIRPIQPLTKHLGKYLLIIAVWLLSSILVYAILQRRNDIHIIDGLISFANGTNTEIEKLRQHSSGKAMAALVNSVVGYQESQSKLKTIEIEQEKNQIISKISAQVAHDIRSPLAALNMVVQQTAQLPEEKRIIIRSSVSRIRDIANNLLQKNKEISATAKGQALQESTEEKPITQLLSSLIDPLITEKRMQFRSKIGIELDGRLDQASYGLFAKIQPTEFKRMISNLVNNSVEVLGEKGTVTVALVKMEDDRIQIKVQDNGKGIPPEILAKLGQRGATHGKEGGSGLGLYHARTTVESWDGKLEIQSEVDKGTTVIVTLPQEHPPEWFVSELWLLPESTIVVLDDDSSIHQVWQGRFDSLRVKEHGIQVLHFSTPDDITQWVHDNPGVLKTATFLADYELLGHKQTGLDVIQALNIGPQSILVTSRFEEKQIMEGCKRLTVRMIPKGLAAFVPISIKSPIPKPDAVLIDDDNLVHLTWKMAAKASNKVLLTYDVPSKFFMDAGSIPLTIPIYVDSQLGDGNY